MPTIQQVSSTGVSNLSVTQATITQEILPIIGVKPSAITHLTASEISDRQAQSARTISTEAFLGRMGIQTTQQKATVVGVDSPAITPSSMSHSVAAKAGVVTPNESFTLSDYINLPIKQSGNKSHHLLKRQVRANDNDAAEQIDLPKDGGVKYITPCLSDYYIQNNNGTTTHRLVSICGEESINNYPISGYVEPKCSVNQTKQNQINAFKFAKQGDLFIAETKDSKECQQPILTSLAPKKIDECLYVSTAFNKQLNTYDHAVVNACNKAVKGHFEKGCLVVGKLVEKGQQFTLKKQGDSSFFVTENIYEGRCVSPIREGERPNSPRPTPNHTAHYCRPKVPNAPDTPKAEKIVGGKESQSEEVRYLVLVDGAETSCTGSLIGRRHVLTAAHCLTEGKTSVNTHPLEQLTIKHDPYPSKRVQYIPSTTYKVVAATIHPSYGSAYDSTNYDVAVLELEKPVVNGQVIPLPTDEEFCEFAKSVDAAKLSGKNSNVPIWQDGNAVIQGFGKQKNKNGYLEWSSAAQEGKVVVTDIGDDEGSIVSFPNVYGTDVCLGDSGGPLIFETRKGKKVQIGVITGMVMKGHCCSEKRYQPCHAKSYYANMGNLEMRKWIEARKTENSKTLKQRDRTRLRFSPDTCVKKSSAPDGFLSWLGIQNKRSITLTNHCYDKNQLAKVNVKFYSMHGETEKQEDIAGIEKFEKMIQLDVGETKTVYTDGTPVKTVLTWSDLD